MEPDWHALVWPVMIDGAFERAAEVEKAVMGIEGVQYLLGLG